MLSVSKFIFPGRLQVPDQKNCAPDIPAWMSTSHLKPNTSKTELLISPAPHTCSSSS